MYFDIDKFKRYQASKIASPTHYSILEMLDTRVKLEKLKPGITFQKENYNQKIGMDCSAFYTQSGTEYLKVDSIDEKNQRVYLDIDYHKLNLDIDDLYFDGFTSIDQAMSVVALGNIHEVLKSESCVREFLHKNKYYKKNSFESSSNFSECQKLYEIAKKFKSFEDKFNLIFSNAHTYMKKNY